MNIDERFQLALEKLRENLRILEGAPKDTICLELIKLTEIYIACFEEALTNNDTNNPALLSLLNQILNVLDENADE